MSGNCFFVETRELVKRNYGPFLALYYFRIAKRKEMGKVCCCAAVKGLLISCMETDENTIRAQRSYDQSLREAKTITMMLLEIRSGNIESVLGEIKIALKEETNSDEELLRKTFAIVVAVLSRPAYGLV